MFVSGVDDPYFLIASSALRRFSLMKRRTTRTFAFVIARYSEAICVCILSALFSVKSATVRGCPCKARGNTKNDPSVAFRFGLV